ncbi:MAG: hypothetical protein BGO58_05580 [Sphingopyxis sp. 65-8]|nr:MAG: hypothetical protein BGO58_05580 [Sphingopyxis sp. 65-8]
MYALIIAHGFFEAVAAIFVDLVNFRPRGSQKYVIVTVVGNLNGKRATPRCYDHASIDDAAVEEREPMRSFVICYGHGQSPPSESHCINPRECAAFALLLLP